MLAFALAFGLVAACGAGPVPTDLPPVDWGPLASYPVGNGGDDALTSGTLEITENCVFVTRENERQLLIWPALVTSWDAPSRAIVYQNSDGSIHRLTTGMSVAFGGGSFGDIGSVDWTSPPQPQCLGVGAWGVNDVVSP